MTPTGGAWVAVIALFGPYMLLEAGPAGLVGVLLLAGLVSILDIQHHRRVLHRSARPAPAPAAPVGGGRGQGPGHGHDVPAASRPEAREEGSDLAELGDDQLCWRWRRSYSQLLAASDPPMVLAVAARRQQILDELARRYPSGFTAWMDSGARAGSDPTRYLQVRRIS